MLAVIRRRILWQSGPVRDWAAGVGRVLLLYWDAAGCVYFLCDRDGLGHGGGVQGPGGEVTKGDGVVCSDRRGCWLVLGEFIPEGSWVTLQAHRGFLHILEQRTG